MTANKALRLTAHGRLVVNSRSRAPFKLNVNTAERRTALRGCNCGDELPFLADTCLMPLQANDDPKQKYTASFSVIPASPQSAAAAGLNVFSDMRNCLGR